MRILLKLIFMMFMLLTAAMLHEPIVEFFETGLNAGANSAHLQANDGFIIFDVKSNQGIFVRSGSNEVVLFGNGVSEAQFDSRHGGRY